MGNKYTKKPLKEFYVCVENVDEIPLYLRVMLFTICNPNQFSLYEIFEKGIDTLSRERDITREEALILSINYVDDAIYKRKHFFEELIPDYIANIVEENIQKNNNSLVGETATFEICELQAEHMTMYLNLVNYGGVEISLNKIT